MRRGIRRINGSASALNRRQLLASVASFMAAIGVVRSTAANAQVPTPDGLDLTDFDITDLEELIRQFTSPDPPSDPSPEDPEPVEDIEQINIETPLDPAPVDRPWDAVKHYVGSDETYLAPRVAEYNPPDPPMPHMKSTEWLENNGYVYEADLERSNLNRRLELKDEIDNFLNATRFFPDGFIINIPPGEYTLDRIVIQAYLFRGLNTGARFIFRGMIGPNGEHPIINCSNSGISAGSRSNLQTENPFHGFEMENIELKSSTTSSDGGIGPYIRYVHFRNVLISGFKNCHFVNSFPTIAVYNNCAFTRGGRGDGLTHCFYGNYVQSMTLRNCLFTSTRIEGHALKTYSSQLDVRGCTFANWWHPEDPEQQYWGDQAPVDIGARSQTIFLGNHIIKRGQNPVRYRAVAALQYRNRVFEAGFEENYPRFGTNAKDFDYSTVNNEVGTANERNPSSQDLFRHLFVNNKVFNGVLPDGTIDPQVEDRPGVLLQNNGTIYNWAHGGGSLWRTKDPSYKVTPTDYGLLNERSVVYVANNQLEGVAFDDLYAGPYGHSDDPSPIVDLGAQYPEWALNRLKRQTPDDHWWDETWPDDSVTHP